MALNEAINTEIQAYQKLNEVLAQSLGQYEKMPSVIQAALLSSLSNKATSVARNRGVGTTAGATLNASFVGKN
jgi:hypothetical protein